MIRCSLFPHNRARQLNSTASPQELFQSLARSFRNFLRTESLQLPSLEACLQAQRDQAPSTGAATGAASKRYPGGLRQAAASSGVKKVGAANLAGAVAAFDVHSLVAQENDTRAASP